MSLVANVYRIHRWRHENGSPAIVMDPEPVNTVYIKNVLEVVETPPTLDWFTDYVTFVDELED